MSAGQRQEEQEKDSSIEHLGRPFRCCLRSWRSLHQGLPVDFQRMLRTSRQPALRTLHTEPFGSGKQSKSSPAQWFWSSQRTECKTGKHTYKQA